jgi:hypothetical protein
MRNASFAAFLFLCAAAPASAQQQPATAAAQPAAAASSASQGDDLKALTDARIASIKLTSDARLAALKAGLKLRPDQEKSWSTFESTVRDLAKQRQDRLQQLTAQNAAQGSGQGPDAITLLRQRADLMSQTSADLKKYADALDPLYKSLDDAQKRRMLLLVAATR